MTCVNVDTFLGHAYLIRRTISDTGHRRMYFNAFFVCSISHSARARVITEWPLTGHPNENRQL